MNGLVIFLIEQILPWVLQNLPAILKFLSANYPVQHAQVVRTVNSPTSRTQSNDQGPNFDWHSGP